MPVTAARKKVIGRRIAQAREARGIASQTKLAELVGVTAQTVQQWEKGDTSPRPQHAQELGEIFEKHPSWFMVVDEVSEEPEPYLPTGPGRWVPLISWVRAGHWNPAADPYQLGEGEKTVQTFEHVSEAAFALTVRGDSMEPVFPAGCVVVVDPLREAENGNYVIARLHGSDEATFKQLVIEGGTRYLKPVNPRYPIITVDEDATICGVVAEMRMRF